MANVNLVSEEYDESSLFCSNCTEDIGLREKIQHSGNEGICSVCKSAAEFTVDFDTLAEWIERIWVEWYHPGEFVPVFSDSSDHINYDQRGDEPELLIGELVRCIGEEERIISALILLMARGDDHRVMQGGIPLISDTQSYQQRKIDKTIVDFYWKRFVVDLKHHTRYFNNSAIELFDKLFDDLAEVYASSVMNYQSDKPLIEDRKVVHLYAPGSLVFYRARKIQEDNISKVIASPESELCNPPDRYAAAGRMNPKGISYFYGAEDRHTCVAELRPSISEKAISAEFELINPVQILDLTLLSYGYHSRQDSMFDNKYYEKQIHKQLLRQLHWLVAQPVVNGDDFEYLPTQAMAEYLARRSNPRIDGIIFESVQRKGGRNIVLFPHVLSKENYSASDLNTYSSSIRMKVNSLVIHETKGITYDVDDQTVDENSKDDMFGNYRFDFND